MIEKAYGKINLALNIVEKTDNDYHIIESVMVPIKLNDSIDIEVVVNKRQEDDYVTCDDYNVAIVKYNLCHKAIEIARSHWHFKERFNVMIHKNIFLQAGLGGGSADAAAVIRGIISLLKLKKSESEIIDICKEIGADVPFMYYSKPSFVTGFGEVVKPFEWDNKYRNYYILLVKPVKGISTKNVFSKYDELEEKNHFEVKKFFNDFLNDGDPFKYAGNSLEYPASILVPDIITLKNALKEKGFEEAFMTGGGSCVVGLTNSRKICKKAFKEFSKDENVEVEITKFL